MPIEAQSAANSSRIVFIDGPSEAKCTVWIGGRCRLDRREWASWSGTRVACCPDGGEEVNMTQTMRAAAIDAFGDGPDSITVHKLPVPDVGADEILIHVRSAGVGVWDPFEAEGGFAEM